MRTIQFTGTENQIINLEFALDISDNNLPQPSEIRVYAIDTFNVEKLNWENLTDEEFMNLAEKEGNVYTLETFMQEFNNSYVDSNVDKIRFISIPLFL